MKRNRIVCVVGARPNFVKIAPILRAFDEHIAGTEVCLLHTGQHYDYAMNESFFRDLEIRRPDVTLDVGSGTHAAQTAAVMVRFEQALDAASTSMVLVVGDVNSTMACAIVAVKKAIKVAHVESGLRSRDRSMPEEINRLVTDQVSDRLYVSEMGAIQNLLGEGIPRERMVFAGNVMIDTLFWALTKAVPAERTLAQLDARRVRKEFGLLTLHRPSNVDDPSVLRRLLQTVGEISTQIDIVFPMHPRTRAKITEFGLDPLLETHAIVTLPPCSYLQMVGLLKDSQLVLTDSGGLQEETTALGIPCLTLRENTERPITVSEGTNRVVGTDPINIAGGGRRTATRCPETAVATGLGRERRGSHSSRRSTVALANPKQKAC